MLACKRYTTIKELGNLELTGLPFSPGQRVEVVIIAEDDRSARGKELGALFQRTQSLPEAQAISEDTIAEEIEAYRAGR